MEVRPIRPGEETAAAELVYRLTRGRVPTGRELSDFVKQAEILGTDPALQSVAVTTAGAIVGCAMFFPMIDRTATVSPPMCVPPYDRVEVKVALVQALRPLAASRGVLMLQACCDVDDAAAEEVLTRGDFEFLATMLFMERGATRSGPKCQSDNRIRWVEYTAERHADFAQFIERSYEGTLDCARLGEFRDVNLTLESYRERGSFDPSLWLLGEIDGAPAAAILMIPQAESKTCELAYMAVSPEFRGKGLGRKVMEKGLSEVASRADGATMSLVVDEANTPAVRLYRAFDFSVTDRRRVFFTLLATS